MLHALKSISFSRLAPFIVEEEYVMIVKCAKAQDGGVINITTALAIGTPTLSLHGTDEAL